MRTIGQAGEAIGVHINSIVSGCARSDQRFYGGNDPNSNDDQFRIDDLTVDKPDPSNAFVSFDRCDRFAQANRDTVRSMLRLEKSGQLSTRNARKNPVERFEQNDSISSFGQNGRCLQTNIAPPMTMICCAASDSIFNLSTSARVRTLCTPLSSAPRNGERSWMATRCPDKLSVAEHASVLGGDLMVYRINGHHARACHQFNLTLIPEGERSDQDSFK